MSYAIFLGAHGWAMPCLSLSVSPPFPTTWNPHWCVPPTNS